MNKPAASTTKNTATPNSPAAMMAGHMNTNNATGAASAIGQNTAATAHSMRSEGFRSALAGFMAGAVMGAV